MHPPAHVAPLYPGTHAQSAVPPADTLHVPPLRHGDPSQTLAEIVITTVLLVLLKDK